MKRVWGRTYDWPFVTFIGPLLFILVWLYAFGLWGVQFLWKELGEGVPAIFGRGLIVFFVFVFTALLVSGVVQYVRYLISGEE